MRTWTLSLVAVAVMSLGLTQCNKKPNLLIDSPAHGDFVNAASVTLEARLVNTNAADWTVTVNGAPVVPAPDGSITANIPLDAVEVFNPILIDALRTNGQTLRRRIVVIAGDSRADGAFSEESVALRLNDTGLDSLETVVSSLVNLDIATLLPPGTVVINDYCAVDGGFLGCLGSVDVVIANPPPSFTSFGLNVDSMTNFAAGDVFVNNIRVDTNINGSGLAPSCGLRITASQVTILGDYSLDPDAADPTNIDVNLIGSPGVSFTNFNDQFTSGLCDFPLIGDLIQLIIGDIQPAVTNGLRDFLADPDGAGPADAPIAEGIETALADISIAGPLGSALGTLLEAPLFAVTEDNDGITLGSDASFQPDCTPPAQAPDLAASYHVSEPFPSFGPLTPGGLPYGIAISASTSAFNQLLKAQTECGLLVAAITELALGSPTPLPLTSDLLSLFVPQFAQFPAGTPMRIEIRPTLAPVVTGQLGPGGEIGELKLGALEVKIVDITSAQVAIAGAVDATVGLDLQLDDVTGSLVFGLAPPTAADVKVSITTNLIGADAPTLEANILPSVIAFLLPDLADSLGAFPLPTFLDLELQGVEVARSGSFMSIFADLTPAP